VTISRKNARSIIINDENFRWTVSPGSGFLILVVEHGTIKGQRIEVYVDSDIDSYWVEIPYVENMNLRLIKPNVVRKVIIEAIQIGWNYKEPGKTIVFDLITRTPLCSEPAIRCKCSIYNNRRNIIFIPRGV